jgi:hypothetical protein
VTQPAPIPWDRFSRDPRVPSYAGLRASDLDRSVALDTLGEAYADGRLDREEYDARVANVQASKTMGELVPPLRDLAPDSLPVDVRQQALASYRSDRREALFAFVVASVITWAIWLPGAFDGSVGFPWPLLVSLFTGVNLVRVIGNKEQIVEQKRAKLERKRRKELGP